jgi:histidinol-phosphate aminotransferase
MLSLSIQVPEYIRSLVPYVPGKPIEETQREFKIKRVVKLASNENPLGPGPKAIQATRKALIETHRYPDASAYRLKTALSKELKVAPQSICIGNGSNEIIDFLVRTYCIAGDAIVTSQGAFVAYKICAQIHGVRTLEAPLAKDLRFDLGAMLKLTLNEKRTRMVFIANPNNPTGTYVTTSELRGFLKALSPQIIVALDYAYWEYVTAKDLPDPMELLREFPNVIVMRTFSKIHGLAGFRVGYGVGAPEIIANLEKVRMPFNVNSLGLVAAEAALKDTGFVKKAREVNRKGMKFWEAALEEMEIPFWKSQGNFLLADVQTGLGLSGKEVFDRCLKRGVIFRPVTNYGLGGSLRISIGTEEENQIAVRAIRAEFFGKSGRDSARTLG